MRGFSFVAVALVLASCDARKSYWTTLTGEAQGTTFSIKYNDSLHRDLSASVDSLFRVIDRSLSLWDSTSTVSRFNAATDTIMQGDEHFDRVVWLSLDIHRNTAGAFDPTVLPLVRAWGLGKGGLVDLDTSSVTRLLQRVGLDRLLVRPVDRFQAALVPPFTYQQDPTPVQFDPNGIAQGYTVDVIAQLLESRGIARYMVEVGGEVRTAGTNEREEAWTIQIDKPVPGEEHVQQTVVPLRDRSLATSGNYRKFIEIGGKRFGHTIDPRTGRPAMNALLSASVIADDCATADALGTALMVMGPEGAQDWLSRNPGVEAYLISDDGKGGYIVWSTPGWLK